MFGDDKYLLTDVWALGVLGFYLFTGIKISSIIKFEK